MVSLRTNRCARMLVHSLQCMLSVISVYIATVILEPSGVMELCPGSNITFVCTNNQTAVLAWRCFEQDYPEGDKFFFKHGSPLDRAGGTAGVSRSC